MVIAHHLMWTLYGWWLTNDPRGSTSQTIRNDILKELGELHFGRKRIQPTGKEVRSFYESAGSKLKYDLLTISPNDFTTVARTFETSIRSCGYACYALAIMPGHVHLVIRKHKDHAETMIENLQELTREQIIDLGLRPTDHPVWTQGGYKVFLDTPDDVWRTIRYVDDNPVKQRLPRQSWDFVAPYDNWPHHKTR